MDTTIDMTETKTKLADLAAHMPEQDETIYEFAAGLAPRLNDRLYPEGLALAVNLYLHDLARGKSGFASLPLPPRLVGYPPVMWAVMKLSVPGMLRATLPPEAAEAAIAALKAAEAA